MPVEAPTFQTADIPGPPEASRTEQDVPQPSPEAPWGYKADGTPYKRNPESYRGGRKRRADGTPPPKRNARPNQPNSAAQTQARGQGIFELLSIPVAGLAMAGQATNSKPLVADAIVLGKGAAPIATAVAQLAEQDARVAQLVDSLIQTGPYAALFTALMPVAVQIGANHSERFAEIATSLGAQSADDVIRAAQILPESEDAT